MRYPTLADIKQFYDWGCYTDEEMREYVKIKWITLAEYEDITGRSYDKPDISVDLGMAHTP
ncbi:MULTISPECIES: XkdX family protein [Bacillus subtilis group]|uniref:XkdX family protein n=1 Tax=Bacillus subtilis group TaxID=653685 RepID=UPI0005B7F04B|nr:MULTISPECIES: XkdX family protein [Bacillus subtilis group]MCR2018058.1 XkdX family protein [Bacillus paralicheniformis]PLS10590.1 XkdX family protein [Bacillus licheniformis]WEZ43957.1 XkdX family protein [Bacillus paralicheniformis]GIN50623.1 hypothetical protein J25TS1_38770 [Bacillus paralicheniformis]